MLKSISQAVRALGAEMRRKLLDIDNYFLSFPFSIPIFSRVSWPSTAPNILQAKDLWFYCPQRINCLLLWWGTYFYLKVLLVITIFSLFLSLQCKSSSFSAFHLFSTSRFLLLWSLVFVYSWLPKMVTNIPSHIIWPYTMWLPLFTNAYAIPIVKHFE